jgi:hypothetical protein
VLDSRGGLCLSNPPPHANAYQTHVNTVHTLHEKDKASAGSKEMTATNEAYDLVNTCKHSTYVAREMTATNEAYDLVTER